MSASKPLIAITTYRQPGKTGVWEGEFAMIPGDYVEAIERAGGTAVLVPPQPLSREDAQKLLSGMDGLMLCGGREVDPARYQQEPLATTEQPDTRRDATEDALLAVAIESGLPILGICRGAQMLNVHRGGTLIQHLPDRVGDTRYQKGGGEFSMMGVNVEPGSALSDIVDGNARIEPVAMYHHQAIDQVGEGLIVSATSDDGIVEGVELPGHPFCVAVQWHPEKTLEDLRLFRALISAAQNSTRS
ncbi:MAG: gamma-glutamyl-gamma-aminobutyrate hydrolase family protein [Pontimonas sp.]